MLVMRALRELAKLNEDQHLVIRFDDALAKLDLTVACDRHSYHVERIHTHRLPSKKTIFEMTVRKRNTTT